MKIGRLAGLMLVTLIALASTGCATAGDVVVPSGDPTSSISDAGSVDIGNGREIFLECRGSGEPTIVLESGIHDASDYWTVSQVLPPAVETPVMDALAETNRVCRYDRPGTVLPVDPQVITDRSTPVAIPRTIGDAVADLHLLLDVAEVPGPYVLVAHSWGGMIGQLYARTYPEEVAGLVLVDAFAPAIRDLLGATWPSYVEVLNNLVDLLPNTPQMIAHGSIHYIQVTEPDLVVSAARLVMARIAG